MIDAIRYHLFKMSMWFAKKLCVWGSTYDSLLEAEYEEECFTKGWPLW
jgi:hypothetical protein